MGPCGFGLCEQDPRLPFQNLSHHPKLYGTLGQEVVVAGQGKSGKPRTPAHPGTVIVPKLWKTSLHIRVVSQNVLLKSAVYRGSLVQPQVWCCISDTKDS